MKVITTDDFADDCKGHQWTTLLKYVEEDKKKRDNVNENDDVDDECKYYWRPHGGAERARLSSISSIVCCAMQRRCFLWVFFVFLFCFYFVFVFCYV